MDFVLLWLIVIVVFLVLLWNIYWLSELMVGCFLLEIFMFYGFFMF